MDGEGEEGEALSSLLNQMSPGYPGKLSSVEGSIPMQDCNSVNILRFLAVNC